MIPLRARSKFRHLGRADRAGFDVLAAANTRTNRVSGLFPNLEDPNLKAAAFYKDGAWTVIAGPASALYGQNLTASLINPNADGFRPSPFWPTADAPMMATKVNAGATAPGVTATTAAQLLGAGFWNGNHTVYTVGRFAAANTFLLGHGISSASGFNLRNTSGFNCRWHKVGAQVADLTVGAFGTNPIGRWYTVSFGRNGTQFFARANGSEVTSGAISDTVADPNSTIDPLRFGSDGSGSFPLGGGEMLAFFFYNSAHSAEKKAEIEALITGAFVIGQVGVVPLTVLWQNAGSGAESRLLGAKEPENLFRYSGDLNNATYWGGLTVTPKAGRDADGNMTADLIASSSPSAYHAGAGANVLTADGVSTYTLTVDIELVSQSTPSNITIALRNGAITHASYVGSPALNTRTSITFTTAVLAAGTPIELRMYPAIGATGAMLVSKLRIHRGAAGTAGAAVRTFNEARIGESYFTFPGNNTRILRPDLGLPAFPTINNIFQWSEDYSNAVWIKTNVTLTANFAESPERGVNAFRAVVTNSAHGFYQARTVTPGQSYVFSFWAKNNGGAAAQYRVWDATAGANIIAPTSYLSQINGSTWTRVVVPFVAPAGCTQANIYMLSSDIAQSCDVLLFASMLQTMTTGASSSVSALSPYVKSVGASETSHSDRYQVSTTGWPVESGIVEVDFTPATGNDNGGGFGHILNSGTSGFGLIRGGTTIRMYLRNVELNVTGFAWINGTRYRFRLEWGNGAWALKQTTVDANGNPGTFATLASGTGALMPTAHAALASIGSDLTGTNGNQPRGWIGRIKIWKP